MKLTSKKLRELIYEEIRGGESVPGQPHWTVADNPKLKWVKVGNKFFVARPQPLQGGVRIIMSSDGRSEGDDFPINNDQELKSLIRFLGELQLTGASSDSGEDFPGDL